MGQAFAHVFPQPFVGSRITLGQNALLARFLLRLIARVFVPEAAIAALARVRAAAVQPFIRAYVVRAEMLAAGTLATGVPATGVPATGRPIVGAPIIRAPIAAGMPAAEAPAWQQFVLLVYMLARVAASRIAFVPHFFPAAAEVLVRILRACAPLAGAPRTAAPRTTVWFGFGCMSMAAAVISRPAILVAWAGGVAPVEFRLVVPRPALARPAALPMPRAVAQTRLRVALVIEGIIVMAAWKIMIARAPASCLIVVHRFLLGLDC